jgi:hypothetical protein
MKKKAILKENFLMNTMKKLIGIKIKSKPQKSSQLFSEENLKGTHLLLIIIQYSLEFPLPKLSKKTLLFLNKLKIAGP